MALIFEPGALRQIFGQQYNSISTLPIDVTLTEGHSLQSSVTEKPVEDGTVISDTTVLHGVKLNMSGIFADERTGKSWAEKWQMLNEIRRTRQPFTVVTSLGNYENMIFTSISADRNSGNSGALFFDAALSQIKVISGQSVRVGLQNVVPAESTGEPPSQSPKKDAGKKQAEQQSEADAASTTESQRQSLLYRVFN